MAESPLLKLWTRLDLARSSYQHQWGTPSQALDEMKVLVDDAEQRWELERLLHKDQVKRIRKQRHEYIMDLRTRVFLMAETAREAYFDTMAEPINERDTKALRRIFEELAPREG